LTISNVRVTYGMLGPERPDNKILPGDRYHLTFDIEGIKTDDDGKVLYTLAMEVMDSQGKRVFGQEPKDLEGGISLGGGRLPVHVFADANLSQPPGEYTIKVAVTDRSTKAVASLTRKFEILARDFGIVRLQASYDDRIAAPLRGEAGQSLTLNFMIVGFGRGQGGNKQPDVVVEMRILDADGKPTLPKPFTGRVSDNVSGDIILLPMYFLVELNRPGKFTIELKATDRTSKKTARASLPLTVTEPRAAAGTAAR